MPDLLIDYHLEPSLPADAVALVEGTEGRIDVYLSEAHPRAVVAQALGPMLTAYCSAAHVEQRLALVG